MSVLQWNIRSIKSNINDLKGFIKLYSSEIVMLQETKLLPRETININTFRTFCRNITPSPGGIAHGGVAIMVKESLNPVEIQLQTSLQAIAVKVILAKPTVICSFYVQEKDRVTKAQIQNLINQLGDHYILGGDMNGHNPLWGHSDYNSLGTIIEDIVSDNDLHILNNGEATYLNKRSGLWSVLDLTISNYCDMGLANWRTHGDLANSDHLPVIFQLIPRPSLTYIGESRFQENKADWEFFSARSADIILDDIGVESYDAFSEALLKVAEKAIPRTSGKIHRRVVSWWTDDIKLAIKQRKTALRRLKRNNNSLNRKLLAQATVKARKLIREGQKKAREEICKSISPQTPIRTVYDNIKMIQGVNSPKSLRMLKINDQTYTEPQKMADIMAEHFCATSATRNYNIVFQIDKGLVEREILDIPENDHPMNNDFSMLELSLALSKCKGKSVGINQISYGMLKNMNTIAKQTFLRILNFLWRERKYPEVWGKAVTIPLQKPGKCAFDPDGKRPISLTCNDSKVFERMAMARLGWWIESNQKLDEAQNGFRKGRGITDNVVLLHKTIVQERQQGRHAVVILFDLAKAYDKLWRRLVLQKLIEWGLGGNMVHFVKNFLEKRTMTVRCNGVYSRELLIENGVPQGTVAAVLCFLIAISDFEKELRSEFEVRYPELRLLLLSYADDKAAVISGPVSDPLFRQACTFVFSFTDNWMERHGLSLSVGKTQILHFCVKRNCRRISIDVRGRKVNQQRCARFLGHIFDTGLFWRQHILERKSSCVKVLGALRFFASPFLKADTTMLIRLVHSLVTSRLLFGSEVYFSSSPSNIKLLRSIYMRALRSAIGAFRTSPLDSIVFESNQLDFEDLILTRNLKYCIRTFAFPHLTGLELTVPNENPLHKTIADMYIEHSEHIQFDASKVWKYSHGPPPWQYRGLDIDMTMNIFKKDLIPARILRRHANHLIDERHRNGRRLLYTDGSKIEDKTGYAVVGFDVPIIERMENFVSVFQAELTAIHRATQLALTDREPSTIITDSLSSLKAISNFVSIDPLVRNIQNLVIDNIGHISFLFVHSHVGVRGNDKADEQARNSIDIERVTDGSVSRMDINQAIRKYVWELRAHRWEQLDQSNKLKNQVRYLSSRDSYSTGVRREDVIISRVRIGHTKLTHSYLLQSPHVPPKCDICDVQLTVRHFLTECPKYDVHRTNIFNSNDIFSSSLNASGRLLCFLKAIGVYDEI